MNSTKNAAASVAIVITTIAAADAFGVIGYVAALLTFAAVFAATSGEEVR